MQLAPLVSKHTKGDESTVARERIGIPVAPTSQSRVGNQHDSTSQKSVYGITTASPQLNSLSVKPASLQGMPFSLLNNIFRVARQETNR